jgi:hypothetical protein
LKRKNPLRDEYLLAELTVDGRWHVWPVEPYFLVDSPDVRVRAAIQGAQTLETAIKTVLSMIDTAMLSSSSWRYDADLWHEVRYSIHSESVTIENVQARAESLIKADEGREEVFEGNYYAIHAFEDRLYLWKMTRCRAKLFIADSFGDNEAQFVCKRPNHHSGQHNYWFSRGREKNVFTTWQHDEFFERWIDQVNMDLDRDLEEISSKDANRVCFMRDDGTVPCSYGEEQEQKYRSGEMRSTKILEESTCYFCRQYA